MARESWAKLHVELLDDAKLALPKCSDSGFKLWVCLILLAKQTTEDGVIHKMGPAALCERFGMGCSPKRVQESLDHFAANGMIALENNIIRILNYERRQAAKDPREQNAERQRRWRARHNDSNGANVTGVTQSNVTRLEETRLDQIPLKPPQGGATHSHPFRSRKAKTAQAKWQKAGASSPEEYEEWHAKALADAKEELK